MNGSVVPCRLSRTRVTPCSYVVDTPVKHACADWRRIGQQRSMSVGRSSWFCAYHILTIKPSCSPETRQTGSTFLCTRIHLYYCILYRSSVSPLAFTKVTLDLHGPASWHHPPVTNSHWDGRSSRACCQWNDVSNQRTLFADARRALVVWPTVGGQTVPLGMFW